MAGRHKYDEMGWIDRELQASRGSYDTAMITDDILHDLEDILDPKPPPMATSRRDDTPPRPILCF